MDQRIDVHDQAHAHRQQGGVSLAWFLTVVAIVTVGITALVWISLSHAWTLSRGQIVAPQPPAHIAVQPEPAGPSQVTRSPGTPSPNLSSPAQKPPATPETEPPGSAPPPPHAQTPVVQPMQTPAGPNPAGAQR